MHMIVRQVSQSKLLFFKYHYLKLNLVNITKKPNSVLSKETSRLKFMTMTNWLKLMMILVK